MAAVGAGKDCCQVVKQFALDDKFQRYSLYLKYWTLNPNFIIKAGCHRRCTDHSACQL